MSTWPQITYIVLACMSFGVNLSRYGQPKTGKYNFIDVFIAPGLGITLMYFGGFFVPLGWAP